MFKRINALRNKGNQGFTIIETTAVALLISILSVGGATAFASYADQLDKVVQTPPAELSCISDVLTSSGLTQLEATEMIKSDPNSEIAVSLSACVAVDASSEPQWLQDDLKNI